MTEKKYFEKSITDSEKLILQTSDSLVKEYYGKTSWGVGDYWKGNLLIRKVNESLDIRKIGEWRQITTDGRYTTALTQYDNFGNYQHEIIYAFSSTPQVEISCVTEMIEQKLVSKCETIWRYNDTGTIRLKSRDLRIDERVYKHGIWEYYSKSGDLERTEEYTMNKRVK